MGECVLQFSAPAMFKLKIGFVGDPRDCVPVAGIKFLLTSTDHPATPPPEAPVNAGTGAAVICVVMSWLAPEIVTVTENDCGPVPKGGRTPGLMLKVKIH